MKIKTEELKHILSYIKKAITFKGILEYSNHFILDKQYIFSFNDMLGIFYPFESDLQGMLKIENTYSIIDGIQDDIIEINIKDTSFNITSKNTNAGLNIIKNIPDFNFNLNRNWKNIPKDFIQGLYLCSFSTAKDRVHLSLTGVYVKDKLIMSSDNYRISLFKMENNMNSLLVPYIGANILYLYRNDIIQYDWDDSWIYFKTENNCVIITRLMQADYPDTASFFHTFTSKENIILPKDIKDKLKTISIFSKNHLELEKKITVEIKNNLIRLKSSSEEGWIDINIPYKGNKDISFTIHPDFFEEILSKTNKMKIGEHSILFEMDNFKHLISLYKE